MGVKKISALAVSAVLAVALFCTTEVFADTDFRYTDRQLMVATQIAYYDFTQEQLEQHGGSATIRQLLNESQVYRNLEDGWYRAETNLEKRIAQKNLELYEEIVKEGSIYGDWKVVEVKDENWENGFYGILLETDPDHAIIAFRGSESDDETQIINDWINADFGLLMDKDTVQQDIAAQFMAEIQQNYQYGQYAATGHSLGGNLAEHAAITAPDGMRERLVQAYNFDGPGYSREYIKRHEALIAKVVHPVVHYRWSLVGALLSQPDCVQARIIQVTDDIHSAVTADANYMRHATPFILFEEDMVKDGEEDLLSLSMGEWSRKADEKVSKLRQEQKSKGPGENPVQKAP